MVKREIRQKERDMMKIKRRGKDKEWDGGREREREGEIKDSYTAIKRMGFNFMWKKWNIHWQQFQKKGKGKNWEMVSSQQLKTKQHMHIRPSWHIHACDAMHNVFMYVLSLLVPFVRLLLLLFFPRFLFVAYSLSIKWDVDVLCAEANK